MIKSQVVAYIDKKSKESKKSLIVKDINDYTDQIKKIFLYRDDFIKIMIKWQSFFEVNKEDIERVKKELEKEKDWQ